MTEQNNDVNPEALLAEVRELRSRVDALMHEKMQVTKELEELRTLIISTVAKSA